MNFDFLKNLRGLGYIYENCSNAEKLAMTMPIQSVFTSRKSAELLAKFIYMAAHNQQMEELTFADILSDYTVRRFINSRDIMDAFHYIRKSGNQAVHSDTKGNSEDAIAVLQDLHYVAGETACMLGLIEDYPVFENKIESFPKAVYVDEKDIDEKARAMFLSYVEEYNAQQERDKYIEMQDYDWLTYSIEGNVEMHERLEFKHKLRHVELIEFLQNYLSTLLRLSIERSPENIGDFGLSHSVLLDARIDIGDKTFTTEDKESFVNAIFEELPFSNGFVIDCKCDGVLREFFNEENDDSRMNMIKKDAVWTGAGMLDTLEQYKRRNNFEYKLAIFYPDSGEFKHEKILNGREIDVLSTATDDIINKTFDEDWWSYSLNLWADFDFEKHHETIEQLHNIVRNTIPESEVPYCEDTWDFGDINVLCSGIQWNCSCLSEIQNFLDKLNNVLLPIKNEVNAGGSGVWEIKNEFAVATWDWTPNGFKVKGCSY